MDKENTNIEKLWVACIYVRYFQLKYVPMCKLLSQLKPNPLLCHFLVLFVTTTFYTSHPFHSLLC